MSCRWKDGALQVCDPREISISEIHQKQKNNGMWAFFFLWFPLINVKLSIPPKEQASVHSVHSDHSEKCFRFKLKSSSAEVATLERRFPQLKFSPLSGGILLRQRINGIHHEFAENKKKKERE